MYQTPPKTQMDKQKTDKETRPSVWLSICFCVLLFVCSFVRSCVRCSFTHKKNDAWCFI